jgi:CHAD domain-containing protein
VRSAFHAAVEDALARIETNARGVLESDDPEFLHQLRVGQRRLRSALRAFRGVLAKESTIGLRSSLRSVSPKLGAARDWDVLVQRLAVARATALLARAEERREKARQAARRTIRSRTFARLAREARALAAGNTRRDLPSFGAAALERAHAKAVKAGPTDWKDPAARHALRIRVKRLRYACEFFAAAFPGRRTTAYIAGLKALQQILGELNDITVGERLIGFTADETAQLRKLRAAWTRFLSRPPFWRARG